MGDTDSFWVASTARSEQQVGDIITVYRLWFGRFDDRFGKLLCCDKTVQGKLLAQVGNFC